MKDTPVLHFLKNFPPWIVLVVITIVFVLLYKVTGDTAFKEWTGLSLASLFTALGVRAATPQPAQQQNIGNVETVNQTTDEGLISDADFENKKKGEI